VENCGFGDDTCILRLARAWWGMQRIGDIPLMRRLVKQAKANVITPATQRLLDAAVTIRQDPESADAAFMARQLVQCTLPHANPGNVPAWTRHNGNLTLAIKAGSDIEGKSFGYPYGTIPRLLLFWMNTEAVKTKSRRLELGHNLSNFMRALDLDPSRGGVRSDARRLKNQMERLFRSTISFQVSTEEPHRHGMSWLDMQVAPEGEFWWDPKRPEQGVLWGSWIELGERFFQAITASPVPVDTRALRALKRSPLALDLYALASYKAFTANKAGPQFIPWEGLLHQLGADYNDKRIDNFKGKVKTTLRKVAAVFPEGLKHEWSRNGLTFLPGTRLAVAAAPKRLEGEQRNG